MIKKKHILSLLFLTAVIITSCEKDFDAPPIKELPEGNILTIDSLRASYKGADSTFAEDYSIYGVVTADASTGNIYKELFIQDETNAIKLSLTSAANYFIGDRIRVAINGATLTDDGGHNMITLENIDPNIAIVKQESNMDLIPEIVTITDINSLVGQFSTYQSKLVKIKNVEFICADACKTWADAINQSDENRTLTDTSGNIVIVRSSGFATFSGTKLPFGNGSIIAVVSQYDNTIQLTIRTPSEATLYGSRKYSCAPCPTFSHVKDFEDESITSGGWSQQNVVGNINWETSNQGLHSSFYGRISNYVNSNNVACETWLISPSLNLSNTSNPEFFMESDVNYSGNALEVYVSTNYSGDVTTATWTQLTVPLDTDNSGWASGGIFVPSGSVSLSAYKQSNVRIAYKYLGGSTNGSTWEIDEIKIIDL